MFIAIIFIVGLFAGFFFPFKKDKVTVVPSTKANVPDDFPEFQKSINATITPDDFYIDHNGRKFRIIENTRNIPRRTYLKGCINGKYWGEIVPPLQSGNDNMVRYNFHIYEAEVFHTELSTIPFSDMSGTAFPRERLPALLPVTLRDDGQKYEVNIHEPSISNAKIIRKLHQTNADEVYGTISADIYGYILDFVEEKYTEKEYFNEAENAYASATSHIPFRTTLPSGHVSYEGHYSRKEYFYSDYKSRYWGAPKYAKRSQGSIGEKIVSFFNWGFLGVMVLVLLMLLMPRLGMIFPFLLIPILFWIFPKTLLNWMLRGITGLLLCCFILSLFCQLNGEKKRRDSKPFAKDIPKEKKTEYKRVVDTMGNTLMSDTLIAHFRVWKDYDGHTYEGKFSVRSSDLASARMFKENIPMAQSTRQNYDQIIYALKNNDSIRLSGLYQLFDSLKSVGKLSEKAFSEMVVSFVQDIPYALILPYACDGSRYSDQSVRNYLAQENARCVGFQKFGINTPVEFLASLEGDCDTRTLFLYTVLAHYGYDVALLSSEHYNHSILGINLPYEGATFSQGAQQYILWETTAPDMPPGILPKEISNLNHWRISLKSK